MIPIKPNLMYENGYIIMASYFPDAAADDGERERGNKIIIISFHGSLLKKSSTAIKLVFRRNWITEKHTRCVSSSTPAIHRERRGEFPSVDTQLPFDCSLHAAIK